MASNLTTNAVYDLTRRVVRTNEAINTTDSLHDPKVRKGTYTFIGGRQEVVAVKVMRPISFFDNEEAEEATQLLLQEVRIYYTCSHVNLASFDGICYENMREKRIPCLIMSFYKNGSIMEYMRNNLGAVRMDLLRQVFAGLTYLHSRNVVHGNLKPTNILIDDGDNALLVNFGLTPMPCVMETLERTAETALSWVRCRYFKLAPELLLTPPTRTLPSDVWPAGMVGLQILSGNIPYMEHNIKDGLTGALMAKEILPSRLEWCMVCILALLADPNQTTDYEKIAGLLGLSLCT
ncbi:kinase-like domain-containing protein [Suillus clintonianus]|uniref:kinase-like domain-containing protein n=1 Tax=Suillus clintonianus TaxID=1904413 RepID=UPI001B85FE17|nr:kinase-like domain-containing protein [Suillus clintonianus]KAG2121969.1 kinase-like domain-containing protein [Suillus clintonianus]